MPMVVRELLSRIADDNLEIKIIILLSAALLAVYLFRILFQFLHDYFSNKAGQYLVHHMRCKTYNHIQYFTPKWFSDKSTGQIIARLSDDMFRLKTLISNSLPDLIISAIMFIGALTILLIINPLLTAFVCIPLPLIFIASVIARRIRRQHEKAKKMFGELLGDLTDNIQGVKEIQAFNRQDYEFERICAQSTKISKLTMKMVKWRAFINPLVSLMQGFGTVTIILVGGIFAISGGAHATSAADITAFVLYIGTLYMPIANLARIIEEVQDSITSGKRVFEILDTKSDIADKPDAHSVGVLQGDVEFKNVTFKYKSEDEHLVTLNNVSFTAPAGKMIALVGPTGSGKTTIASLIARFYDVNKGSVMVDGIDIRDMTLKSLRDNISIVLQDVFLFNGTLSENIGYGKENATLEEVTEAAKMACLDDFVKTLPEGYDTVVGERGTRLSGGQKQRVALARAILRNSSILILDEATSAVDNETEAQIQAAINKISGSRTMIVIAHRLSTIERADQILFLENGQIKESGTFTELIAMNGHFAKMRNM